MALKIIGALLVALAIFIFVARKVSSTVEVTHVLSASPDKVWAMWTDPETMKQWWGPTDYTAPVIQSDLQINGKFFLAMKSAKGEMFYNVGTYTEIETNKKIVSTMAFADEHSNALPGSKSPVPGAWPDYLTVTVEFIEIPSESGAKTEVKITEVGIPLIMKLFASMGWQQQFLKMDELLK